jgi:hypothetical protein
MATSTDHRAAPGEAVAAALRRLAIRARRHVSRIPGPRHPSPLDTVVEAGGFRGSGPGAAEPSSVSVSFKTCRRKASRMGVMRRILLKVTLLAEALRAGGEQQFLGDADLAPESRTNA